MSKTAFRAAFARHMWAMHHIDIDPSFTVIWREVDKSRRAGLSVTATVALIRGMI